MISTRYFTALCLLLSICLLRTNGQTLTDTTLQATPIVTDLPNDVIGFSRLPGGRILTIQRSGEIQVVVNGSLSSALINIDALTAGNGEQGLLGIAVHPEFPDSNYVYTYHTRADSFNQISRYEVTGDLSDPNSSNISIPSASQQLIFEVYNETQYHQGGTLRFGGDGKLYASLGDDGRKFSVQSYESYRGKIVRLNPDGSIPTDNPSFPDVSPQEMNATYIMGLRNPFRFAIDPMTQDLLIGDVGAILREELSLASGGDNLGWPRYEGDSLTLDTARLLDENVVAPLIDYKHSPGSYSVMGLAAYRPVDYPNDASFPPKYDGALFYADYFRGPIYVLLPDTVNGGYTRKIFAEDINRPVDAALDVDGSLIVLASGRTLWRIGYKSDTSTTTGVQPELPRPAVSLNSYPNPFQEEISFNLILSPQALPSPTTLKVYNQMGQLVAVLLDEHVPGDRLEILWQSNGQPAGVYHAVLEHNGEHLSQSLIKR